MPLPNPPGKPASILLLAVIYAVATAVGALVLSLAPGSVPLRLAQADLAATLAVFLGSVALRNSSVYDPYWSVAPPLLLLGGMALDQATGRGWLLLAVLTLWSLRLTANFLRGWPGLGHEDWRYVQLRQQTGWAYWLVSLLGLHLMPTLVVLAGMVPASHVIESHVPIGKLDLLGAAVVVVGTAISLVADEQVRTFKRTADPGAVCTVGLWEWSRHPNYLGEILVWVGVWMFGVAAERWSWHWSLVGPGVMVLLFVAVSIPLQERRARAVRRGWDAYVARTGMLLPAPWKR